MIISALTVGGEVVYGEDEILHLVDFLDALPEIRDYDLMGYDDLVAGIAAAQADATAALAAAAAALGEHRRVTLWHDEANVSGGTLTVAVNTIYQSNFSAFSTVQGFNAVQSFVCATMPACKLRFLGTTANNQGIMGVYVDEVSVGTLDWWSAATVNNVVKQISFAANAIAAGRHTLRLEVVSKNGASSSYALVLQKYWLAPDNDYA